MNYVQSVKDVIADLNELEGTDVTVGGLLFLDDKVAYYNHENIGILRRRYIRPCDLFLSSGFGRMSVLLRGESYLTPYGYDSHFMERRGLLRLLQDCPQLLKIFGCLPGPIATRVIRLMYPHPAVKVVSNPLIRTLKPLRVVMAREKTIGGHEPPDPPGYFLKMPVVITGRVTKSPQPEFAFVMDKISSVTAQVFVPRENRFAKYSFKID